MERVTKLLLFLITAFLVVFGSDVEGARTIKSNEKVDQPQTFFGSFPTPGFSGSFPTPGVSGSFPRPGFGSSAPSFGFGPAGSGSFCAFFPGTAGCAPPRPKVSGGPVGGASP